MAKNLVFFCFSLVSSVDGWLYKQNFSYRLVTIYFFVLYTMYTEKEKCELNADDYYYYNYYYYEKK